MRISELAEASGVPVPTLKYYLREQILMPGHATSRTRADYGEEHLERIRLVRALMDSGGVGIAGVRAIVSALADPPASRHDLLGAAHDALALPGDDAGVSAEVADLLARLGWAVSAASGPARAVGAALENVRRVGIDIDHAALDRYAAAMRAVAQVDLEHVTAQTSPAAALRLVVMGNVMLDPVLVGLRRVAQEALSAATPG